MQQKTIASDAKLSGKGLFSGQDVKVTFKPAEPETGIVFVRTDLSEAVRISATAENIVERDRRTALQNGSVGIETPEHCLAAVNALGIDNLIVEIDGVELPGFDGSCDEYFKTLEKAGLVEQPKEKKKLIVHDAVSLSDGDKSIYALPYGDNGLHITYELDYTEHTGIGSQVYTCHLTRDHFARNLSTARTFVLEAEARQMQAAGIGTHLTPKDILVINSDGPIKNSFRFPDECVRHKVIDLIGDLMLVGRPVSGRIVACKSGHSLNQKLARKLVQMALRADANVGMGSRTILDIRRIQKILPHRYPFLLVDKVVEIEGDKRIKGIKNVTFNEQFFQGHFPSTPIMPGVLIVEALAQVSGLLFAQKLEHTGKLAVLLTMDGVKIRKSVVPGDQLVLIAEAARLRSRAALCNCTAMVGDEVVAEARLKFMLVDDEMV
ncbi:MAG: UDP-3-O-[3-hydroxymyristoyl] N-acetylglucosamine deacetylase [Sedimentisphaerales bacterium]|nr:UDP-3-O-[3-hydroxymyristoyl] N-acetylglucosamine deacetylase [Sedimentisphaerales bacterium]